MTSEHLEQPGGINQKELIKLAVGGIALTAGACFLWSKESPMTDHEKKEINDLHNWLLDKATVAKLTIPSSGIPDTDLFLLKNQNDLRYSEQTKLFEEFWLNPDIQNPITQLGLKMNKITLDQKPDKPIKHTLPEQGWSLHGVRASITQNIFGTQLYFLVSHGLNDSLNPDQAMMGVIRIRPENFSNLDISWPENSPIEKTLDVLAKNDKGYLPGWHGNNLPNIGYIVPESVGIQLPIINGTGLQLTEAFLQENLKYLQDKHIPIDEPFIFARPVRPELEIIQSSGLIPKPTIEPVPLFLGRKILFKGIFTTGLGLMALVETAPDGKTIYPKALPAIDSLEERLINTGNFLVPIEDCYLNPWKSRP